MVLFIFTPLIALKRYEAQIVVKYLYAVEIIAPLHSLSY